MKCIVCGKEFESKRSDARFCSGACRTKYNRNAEGFNPENKIDIDVPAEAMEVIEESDRAYFPHYRLNKRTKSGYWEDNNDKPIVYEADTWEDVPFNAIPIKKRGNPPIPKFMNGREYYLWQLTGFKKNDNGDAIVFNPMPKYNSVTTVMGGDTARMWSGR